MVDPSSVRRLAKVVPRPARRRMRSFLTSLIEDPDLRFKPPALAILDASERDVLSEVHGYTMISDERLVANMDAVKYAVHRGIEGAVVECGVWRGGSILAMIRALQHSGVQDRDVFLYDTFAGMTQPGSTDTSEFEQPALATWQQAEPGATPWQWAFDPSIYDMHLVKDIIHRSGYPEERIHFVKGPVEKTIPKIVPERIAVLRLDTDWYESTLHELRHLYPRLSDGGVLIVDDYGHWHGCRRAVDEYFSAVAAPIFLARTDYSGRVGIKH